MCAGVPVYHTLTLTNRAPPCVVLWYVMVHVSCGTDGFETQMDDAYLHHAYVLRPLRVHATRHHQPRPQVFRSVGPVIPLVTPI